MSTAALPTASGMRVRAVLKQIWRTHRRRFLGVITLLGAGSVLGLAPPRLIGLLIDRLDTGGGVETVALFCAAMLGCVLGQFALVLLGTRTALLLGEDVFADLRNDFMTGALAIPMGLLEQGGTGELITRTTQDISSVSKTVRQALPASLVAGSTVVLTLIAAAVTSPAIAPVYLLTVPVLVVAMRWYLARADGVYRALGESFGPVYAALAETASGARTVEALGLNSVRDRVLGRAVSLRWVAVLGRIRLRQVMLPWTNFAFAVPVFASLAWGGWLALHDVVSIGTAVSVTLFAAALVAPLEQLVGWTDELQKGFVSFSRILGVSEATREAPGAGAEPHSERVELRDVRFAYRAGQDVAHGVSLRVVPGERLAVVGPSGAGKSTVARLLAGIDTPTSGRAMVGGVDVGRIHPDRRRREIMLVSQESHIFAASVRENVILARADADDDELRRALAATGALNWVEALDRGWDTDVGARGTPLSGAQEQQLALARVVLADPHTVILDEATSAMDPTAARDIEAALGAALRGRTVIAIAHRLSTAHDADRIAVVEAGRIVELGTHEELVASCGSYSRLWQAWSDDGGTAAATEQPR